MARAALFIGLVVGLPSACSGKYLTAAANRACGVTAEKQAFCWGEDLGDGANDLPNGVFGHVSAGREHTCGIGTPFSIKCWGQDGASGKISKAPTREQLQASLRDMSAGPDFTCGIVSDNKRGGLCWGDIPDPPSEIAGILATVSSGSKFVCGSTQGGTTDRRVVCWGDDSKKQVSDAPKGMQFWGKPSAGDEHACVNDLRQKTVVCWGSDSSGQVSKAPKDKRISSLACGAAHSCGLLEDTLTPVCWGSDSHGQVSNTPVDVPMIEIAAGGNFACGIRNDTHSVECWGDDSKGQVSGAPRCQRGWGNGDTPMRDASILCNGAADKEGNAGDKPGKDKGNKDQDRSADLKDAAVSQPAPLVSLLFLASFVMAKV
mmetsp:Transcript_103355/g.298973  ORF Transcript_103355/g.298973 Transcript_103355/m.298973 type:complete len:374 (+) Transcript_103355:93-1214(+)